MRDALARGSQRRAPDPKVNPTEQYLVDERGSIDSDVEVAGEVPEGDPWARDVATIDRETGKVVVIPNNFKTWIGRIPEEDRAEATRSLLGEEAFHLKTPDALAKKYWENLTAVEKAIETRIYEGKVGGKGV